MKLADIILKEGVKKRMINFLDDLHSNKKTISVPAFMQEFGVTKDEAIDFIHKWNMSKIDRSVMDEALTIAGKKVKTIHKHNSMDPEDHEIEYEDGTKEPYLKHLKKESISLSEPNEDMEKLISRGIKRINIGSSDEEDVLYYIHNNWMGGYISAEEAMKKISKYLDPR